MTEADGDQGSKGENHFSARIKHKQLVVFSRQRQVIASVGARDRSLDRAPNDFGFGKAKTVAFVGENRSPHFHTLPTGFREDPSFEGQILGTWTVAKDKVGNLSLSCVSHGCEASLAFRLTSEKAKTRYTYAKLALDVKSNYGSGRIDFAQFLDPPTRDRLKLRGGSRIALERCARSFTRDPQISPFVVFGMNRFWIPPWFNQ